MQRNLLLIGLLALAVAANTAERFGRNRGVDFYHYWGVARARALSGATLGSPYPNGEAYAARLNALADVSQDGRFRLANHKRRKLDLTATPLLYAACFFLPERYSHAYGAFVIAQLIAFLLAAASPIRLFGTRRDRVVLLALVLALMYGPLISDMHVGNVNCFQLLAIVGLATVAAGAARRDTEHVPHVRNAALMSGVVALMLLKPNLALIGAAVVAHVWARHGFRALLIAAGPAAALAALLVWAPCRYFDAPDVWNDWYQRVHAARPGKLAYRSSAGNSSLVLIAHEQTSWGLLSVTLGAAGLLAASVGAVCVVGGARLRAVLSDPHATLCVGVVATLAASPLVWYHYYVLAVYPALWLIFGTSHKLPAVCGGIGLLVAAGPLTTLAVHAGARSFVPTMNATGWIPLWIGVLAALALSGRAPDGGPTAGSRDPSTTTPSPA